MNKRSATFEFVQSDVFLKTEPVEFGICDQFDGCHPEVVSMLDCLQENRTVSIEFDGETIKASDAVLKAHSHRV
jgi:hypothetical protein